MSLKAFHVVFIVVSSLLCVGFGAWCLIEYRRTNDVDLAWGAAISIIGLVALSVYGRWFLRKLRGVGYL